MDYDIIEARYLHDFTVWVRCRSSSSSLTIAHVSRS